jgi:hypothetical protein
MRCPPPRPLPSEAPHPLPPGRPITSPPTTLPAEAGATVQQNDPPAPTASDTRTPAEAPTTPQPKASTAQRTLTSPMVGTSDWPADRQHPHSRRSANDQPARTRAPATNTLPRKRQPPTRRVATATNTLPRKRGARWRRRHTPGAPATETLPRKRRTTGRPGHQPLPLKRAERAANPDTSRGDQHTPAEAPASGRPRHTPRAPAMETLPLERGERPTLTRASRIETLPRKRGRAGGQETPHGRRRRGHSRGSAELPAGGTPATFR